MALDELQIDKLVLGVEVQLNNSIKNLDRIEKKVQSLYSTLNKLNIDKLNFNVSGGTGRGGSATSAKTKGSIFDVGNLYHIVRLVQFVGRGLQKIGNIMKDVVQSGIDYTETLNLWQVAMGKNADQAEEFVNRMAKAYGYATTTIMQYQATFRNMLSNLGGVDSNVSYKLSEYLMQMAGDYASLYNVSIEKAMQSFQSVLAGQVRPIRSISGYDITENTIFELYQSLGGEKTMRQLSQTEKRVLRIMAIFQQMERSGAVGDLAKTLGNSANQLRIINEQVTELKTWLGNILEMYLRPVLPIVQAFLIVATEVAKVIAKNLGYEAFDGAISGLEETNEQADELAGKLLSFDKFEALNSSSGDNALGIDSKLLEGMARYESLLDHSKTLAQEMADDILPLFINENGELTAGAQKIQDAIEKIFGFTKNLYELNEEGGFGEWSKDAEALNSKLKALPSILLTIITLLSKSKFEKFGLGITTATSNLGSWLKGVSSGVQGKLNSMSQTAITMMFGDKLEDAFNASGILGKVKNTELSIARLSGELDKLSQKDIKNVTKELSKLSTTGLKTGINWGKTLTIIGLIGAALVYLYQTNDGVRQSVDNLFEALKPLGDLLTNFLKSILPAVGSFLQAIAPVFQVLINLITTVVKLLDFSNYATLGSSLKAIWTQSPIVQSPSYATPNASTNFNYGSTPNGITSPSTAITQSTYNATMASANSTSVVNGDVYIDGKKAGQILAPHTFNENVRIGNIQPKK